MALGSEAAAAAGFNVPSLYRQSPAPARAVEAFPNIICAALSKPHGPSAVAKVRSKNAKLPAGTNGITGCAIMLADGTCLPQAAALFRKLSSRLKESPLKFDADLRARAPNDLTGSKRTRRVERQFEGVWNACRGGQRQARSIDGDVSHDAIVGTRPPKKFGGFVNLDATITATILHDHIIAPKY